MIDLVGFDADDTLWLCEDYFQAAHQEFERIIGHYLDLADARVHERLLETERRNIALFGYGAKGMTLSMIETAIALTGERIAAVDLHRIVELGKGILAQPVELLPGIREAVSEVAAEFHVVLVTKGDLFHQERKVADSGLGDLFRRIEIVSEKDIATYQRLFAEFGVPAERFAMVGNSLRSDIEPVVRLGGYGVYVPHSVTWAHEAEHGMDLDHPRMRQVARSAEIPAALRALAAG